MPGRHEYDLYLVVAYLRLELQNLVVFPLDLDPHLLPHFGKLQHDEAVLLAGLHNHSLLVAAYCHYLGRGVEALEVGLVQQLSVETVAELFVLLAGDEEHIVGVLQQQGGPDGNPDLQSADSFVLFKVDNGHQAVLP